MRRRNKKADGTRKRVGEEAEMKQGRGDETQSSGQCAVDGSVYEHGQMAQGQQGPGRVRNMG